MKFFLDTSVLVAALVRGHPHHLRAFGVFRSVAGGEHEGYVSTHTLAEFYAVITRLPMKPAVHSSEAMVMVDRDIFGALPSDRTRRTGLQNHSGEGCGKRVARGLDLRCALAPLCGEGRSRSHLHVQRC